MKRTSPRLAPLCVLLLSSALVGAQTTPSNSGPRLTPNFQNAEIAVIAQMVGEATGINFIVDQRARAQISFTSNRALTPRELYDNFLSMLQVYGFAAVPTGNGRTMKIVPEQAARTLPGVDMPKNMSSIGSDELVTVVLATKNVSALQTSQILRTYVGPAGNLAPVPGTNTMILTDRASNVKRLKELLEEIDQGTGVVAETFRLQHATAKDVVTTLKTLTPPNPADASGGQAVQIVSDDRTNSVIVSGDPAQRQRIKVLIDAFDMPIEDGGGTDIRYLRYTRAEKIAPKLKEMATGVAAVAAGGAAATTSATAAADRSVSIIADEYTNSLILTAPPKTMRVLKEALNKLDIPLAQVSITAIVADVSDTKAADIGVNWVEFSNKEGTSTPASGFISPVGSGNGNPISIVDLATAVADPAAATKVPLGATFAIGRTRDNGLNLGLMVRALRSDGNSNVLVESSVTAMDNQEAQLENAKEVPFISGQYTNTGGNNNGNVNPFTTVNRQKVGTILKVTPQINGNNELILNIDLTSSELTGTTGDAGSQITDERSVKTSIRVASGETIVLGGLIKNSKSTGETRVPFLGRIPLVGELFKSRNAIREKSNLMVFIRPQILMDGVQAAAETNAKYNILREAQETQNGRKELIPLLPSDKPPLLPELPPPTPATTAPAGAAIKP